MHLHAFSPSRNPNPRRKVVSKAETKVEPDPEPQSKPEARTEVKPSQSRHRAVRRLGNGESGDCRSGFHPLANAGRSPRLFWLCAGGWLAVHYFTQKLEPGSAVRTLTASGVVVPTTTTPVRARVSGVIQAVYCAVNTNVKAGQLCAKIDPHPYQARGGSGQGRSDGSRSSAPKGQCRSRSR